MRGYRREASVGRGQACSFFAGNFAFSVSLGRAGQRGEQRFATAKSLSGSGNRFSQRLGQRILRQAPFAAPLHHAGVVMGVDARLQPLEHFPPHRRHLVQRSPLVRLRAVGHQLFFPNGQDPSITLVRRKVAGDLRQCLEDRQPFFGHGDPHAPVNTYELLALGLGHRIPRRHDGRLARAFIQCILQSGERFDSAHCQLDTFLQAVVIPLGQGRRGHRQSLFTRKADFAGRSLNEMP